MDKIRVGLIGLGCRGTAMLKEVLLKSDDVEIIAVCDVYRDRMDEAARIIEECVGKKPFTFEDYRELLCLNNVEAVLIYTDWATHISIAEDAMERGKAVGMEVGNAYSVQECWDLVRTYEKTRSPFMLLENCCFDRAELLVTNLVRKGMFGTIVHLSGSYGHDLREEIADGYKNRHYRKDNYIHRNCENYPTHELGPIAKILNVNRGNRLMSLVSFSSKSAGMTDFIKRYRDNADEDLYFNQGDVVTTLIKCANGETITLKLDTTLPRRYDREFTVRGTKGNFSQTLRAVYLDGEDEWTEPGAVLNSMDKYEKYLPPVWKNITEAQRLSGHGGMDAITVHEFARALRTGSEMPVDVYDAAAWMSVTALSAASVAAGGTVQFFPDFTRGKWVTRKPHPVTELPGFKK